VQRRFVDRCGQSRISSHPVFAGRVSDGCLPTASDDCASNTRLARITALIPIQIFVYVPGGSRRAKHRHAQRVLETDAKYPWHATAQRVKDRVAFRVNLQRKTAHQRNREAGAHYRRFFVAESIDALDLPFRSQAAEPRKDDLLTTDPEHRLLVHETAAIARLLDSCLHLQHAPDAGPARVRRPIISWRSIGY